MIKTFCEFKSNFHMFPWALLFLCILHVYAARYHRYLQSSACVDSTTDVLCPHERMIAIRRVVYGSKKIYCPRNRTSCCEQKREDCFIYHDAAVLSMNTYCSAHRECSASTRVTSHLSADACPHPTNYGTILYDCIESYKVIPMGGDLSITGSHVYLSNSGYPSVIPRGNTTYTCRITSKRRGRLIIKSIDLVFTGRGWQPRICDQTLIINSYEGPNVTYTCTDNRVYGFRQIYASNGRQWGITLVVKSKQDGGKLWLAASATNKQPLTVSCSSTGYFVIVNTKPSSVPLSTNHFLDSANRHPTHTVSMLIKIVAGIAVVVILFAVAAIIWRCSRRGMPHKPSVALVDKPEDCDKTLHFPDVCQIHEYTAIPTDKFQEAGNTNEDAVPLSEDGNDYTSEAPHKGLVKLKKKVSFKEILANRPETQSNASSSRPNSYISSSSFFTFGKVDDDIDDVLVLQNRELPPPPDWIAHDDPMNGSGFSYDRERLSRRISSNSNLSDFYHNIMSGEVFDDVGHFSIYDDIDELSCHTHCPKDNDIEVIDNELYEPTYYPNEDAQ